MSPGEQESNTSTTSARRRQQDAVAALGQQALESDDLDALFATTVARVSETLECQYAKVLERRPDGESLRLRSGVGWHDGLEGAATVPTDRDSQAGYTLLREAPVVVNDLETETRFSGPDLLTDHGVESGVSVVIGSVQDPWGVLGVHDTERRAFSEQDATFVQNVANLLASAIETTQTQRRFEAIFEDPNILVGLLEPDGTVVDINQTAMEYVAADLADVVGEPFWETPWWGRGRDVREDVREWTERAADGEYVDFQADLVRPDGARYTLEGVFRPVTDDDGDVVSIIVSDRDVSDRRERERELRKSEQRYRTLAENFPNGIVTMFDANRRYTLAAGRAFEVLPIAADDVEGEYVGDVWDGEMGATLESAFADALHGETQVVEGEYAGREWVIRVVPLTARDTPNGDVPESGPDDVTQPASDQPDGSSDTSGEPSDDVDAHPDVFGGMTIAQDVTEQVERERRLAESNRRLEQFAYAASHDLQEPLRMVSSYLTLLESRYGDELDEDASEFLAFAVDGANRMREMIDGLLAYSRVDTQGQPLEPVDLAELVDDVLADLQVQIDDHDATVTRDDLPEVMGDPAQLRRVFQNLVTNAITYNGSDPEPPQVTLESAYDECTATWEIAVCDNGIGIAETDQDRIFEVFERLHSREQYAGTGIGLALTQRILERHGGEVLVDSEPGEGSTFTVRLPAVSG